MEQEPNYLTGYNQGYRLAQYSPELVEKLLPSLSSENEYEEGLFSGIEKYQQEKRKENERLNELDDRDESQEQSEELER